MMPLRVAMPKSAMNPIMDATFNTPPDSRTPATPPMSASGKFSMTRRASRERPKAKTSSMNNPATTAAPSSNRRSDARCSASNCPPYSTRYPAGIRMVWLTADWMSATTPPRSRPATLDEMTIRRCTFSRRIILGPISRRTPASSLTGTGPAEGVSTGRSRRRSKSA